MPLVARGPSFRPAVRCGGLLAVFGDGYRSFGAVFFPYHALGTLAVIWVYPTRLETRTKESNMCASLRVSQTPRRNESESGFGRRGETRTAAARRGGASSTDLFYS